jgi:chromosome condensin MukBEF MukE localization factor
MKPRGEYFDVLLRSHRGVGTAHQAAHSFMSDFPRNWLQQAESLSTEVQLA